MHNEETSFRKMRVQLKGSLMDFPRVMHNNFPAIKIYNIDCTLLKTENITGKHSTLIDSFKDN